MTYCDFQISDSLKPNRYSTFTVTVVFLELFPMFECHEMASGIFYLN